MQASSTFVNNLNNSNRKRSEGIIRKTNLLVPCVLSFFLAVACLTFQSHYLTVNSSSSTANLKEKQQVEKMEIALSRNNTGNDSIFNCDGRNGRCVYFYATKFFHPDNGIGKDYRYILEHIESLRRKRQLWPHMPRIGFPTFSFHENIINPMTNQPFHTHNVTFIHVHKAGKKRNVDYVLIMAPFILFFLNYIYYVRYC
jgi:hypothetical protein